MSKKSIYWYRIAQCCVNIHLENLAEGRSTMLNDLVVSNEAGKIVLPCKELYNFRDEDENRVGCLVYAVKCLKNALILDVKGDIKEACMILLSYAALNVEPQLSLQIAQQLLTMETSESTKFTAQTYISEALLILGRTKQARDAIGSI